MNSKAEMITMLKEEFNRWEALLGSMNEAQITAPHLPANWSIKDVMAHLWAWQQLSIARLEAAQLNREPIFPLWPAGLDPEPAEGQPHDVNAWLFKTYRNKPWADIYQNWRDGFLRFLELAEAIPKTDLLDEQKYPWLEGYSLLAVLQGSFVHHHEDHLEPLLVWLGKQ